MTAEQYNKKLKREKNLAADALKKSGYVKTSWGYILEDRFKLLKSKGLVNIKDGKAGFTQKGVELVGTKEINAYLTGRINSFSKEI